ncbi:MAG TPA: nucleotide exchange factor GrpE [Actinomycetota bacterium]
MSEKDQNPQIDESASSSEAAGDEPASSSEAVGQDQRPKVKVTDRRRVHAQAEASPEPEGAGTPGSDEPADVTELDTAKKQAAEYLDHLQRLQAEFANYRKRVIKEQTRAMEMAAEPFVRKLLEVLDEFDLALMAAERTPDFQKFLHGVELVYAKLLDILRSEGLERIEAEGKPFDPERHEALMQSGGPDGEPFVADVLRPGYTMKGRVIRPAGVKVVRR